MAFKLFDNVMESSTTTGTGDFTLAGAITGFSTFASRYSTGDTCYYAIKEVDAAGGPSGAWEVGIGTYSAANTLTRTTVLSSSNSDALVNFAAGTKRAFVTLTALQGASIREKLTAARTYYVRTDGSDSNTGLANTAGGAFLTIQKACDVITETLDLASYTVTVQVADGTYTGAVTLRDCTGRGGFSVAVLQGNSGTPGNVIISTTSANAILSTANATQWLVKDLKVQTTTSGNGLYASVNSYVSFTNVVFGACATSHINASYGGTAAATGNYSITAAAPYHWVTSFGGRIVVSGRTVTITGTPAFSTGFAGATHSSVVYCPSNTFSGSATGKRYTGIAFNGIVDTNGGGSTYLPGGTAGDAPTTGGQYA